MGNNIKILAIVIIYNPDKYLLRKNIESFVRYVDKILIWDNSSSYIKDKHVEYLIPFFPEIQILGNGVNHGISEALNYAWKYAKDGGFDTLLTMDQDSFFVDFKSFKERVNNKWHKDGLSLCGPTPNLHEKHFDNNEFVKVPDLITSGMLVPIVLLDISGGYCNDFFLDGIDVDLCTKMEIRGYNSYRDNGCNLVQRFGNPKSKIILGKRIYSAGYSASRLYGIFRNHIIIWRRYNHPREVMKKILFQYFLKFVVIGVIFVDYNKREKLISVYKGIRDGKKYKI